MNNRLTKEIIKNTFIIGIILLFASVCTYFIYNKFQTTRNVDYNSKSLDIVYHDNGNKIAIEKATPMTDSVGLSSKAYNLTVKNNLTIPVDYKVRILNDAELDLENEDNLIPKEDIKISIKEGKNQNKIYNLNELEKGILLDSTINALAENEIYIRVWVNKDSTIVPGSNLKYHGIIQVIENDSVAITREK